MDVGSCQAACASNCNTMDAIKSSYCSGLCVDHCMNYENYLTVDQTKCLLMCNYLNNDNSVCNKLCRIELNPIADASAEEITEEVEKEDKLDKAEGCLGFGRELCYKMCRLHHYESIEICLCACCKCKF